MILIGYSLVIQKKISIDILSNLKPIQFIDVNELNKGYDLDYILIILFLGNDYLPKLSNVDYEVIINNYTKYKKHENPHILVDNKINRINLINYLTYIILDKKIKLNYKNIDNERFEKYYNNISWCLKKYKVIDNDNEYIEDTNNVINIYNFIYS
jgi:5'-3' exonuclease